MHPCRTEVIFSFTRTPNWFWSPCHGLFCRISFILNILTVAGQSAEVQCTTLSRVAHHVVTKLEQAVQGPDLIFVLITFITGRATFIFSSGRPTTARAATTTRLLWLSDRLNGAGIEARGQLDMTHDCKESFCSFWSFLKNIPYSLKIKLSQWCYRRTILDQTFQWTVLKIASSYHEEHIKKTSSTIKNLSWNGNVSWSLNVLHGTLNANKEPLLLRAYNKSDKKWLYAHLQTNY